MRGSLAWPAFFIIVLPALALSLNGLLGRSAPPKTAADGYTPVVEDPAGQTTTAPLSPTSVASSMGQAATSGLGTPWAKIPLLETAVQTAMGDFPGEYSVIVHDLSSGRRLTVNPDKPYHPASTIKLPVALYTLEQYRAGKASWQDLIEYTPADFESPGGGAFETSPFGGLYPIENLVNRALTYSNNVAVNMLGRHFGWAQIEAWTKTIGGDITRVDGSPQVTAMSALAWWLHLYQLSQEDPESAELVLKPLRAVTYDGRITAGLPPGTPHLHKFGSYDGNFHDTAIVFTEQPYILIVMTRGAEIDQADAAIALLSAKIYAVMTAAEA